MPEFNRLPLATYRLQFNRDFTFAQATAILPYLKELGISDVYASPLFEASPQSTHGYDVCRFDRLNPVLGTEDEFEKLAASLLAFEMGLLLDMVPNHMGTSPSNHWWNDVLKFGPHSRYANFFDINWDYGKGKILLPVLGERYANILEGGEIKLEFAQGEPYLVYYDKRFPISPQSLESARDPADRHALKQILAESSRKGERSTSWNAPDSLIKMQHYRLAFWRAAREEINYRRFFDVSELVSLRVEDEAVFNASHEFLFNLLHSGKVTGIRIDHPDGLCDPTAYLSRLQQKWERATRLYVVVEKILSDDEKLPENWSAAGTTGYDFLNVLNGLFVPQQSEEKLTRIYHAFTGECTAFEHLAKESKKWILENSLLSELTQLTARLKRIAEQTRYGIDFTANELRCALVEFIANFPVYRTYIDFETDKLSETDKAFIEQTVQNCQTSSHRLSLEFLSKLLLLENYPDFTSELARESREFILKFQQLSGPATAKGLEDTAFYRYHRLVSLNEVGGNPARFGRSPQEFHQYNLYKSRAWPHSFLATATHDTKRGEDVRARLNVLSEIPDAWQTAVQTWSELNSRYKSDIGRNSAPSAKEEYLFYQTVLGTWDGTTPDEIYIRRVQQYMTKSLREGKENTSWLDPNEDYEKRVSSFVQNALLSEKFLTLFRPLQERVSRYGILNSLAQTVLKIASPGVPDFYQGTEVWDFNLVDPDNRRPVDYEIRKALLSEIKSSLKSQPREEFLRALLANPQSGAVKLFTIWVALNFRQEYRDLFDVGAYSPLHGQGCRSENVIAFSRSVANKYVLIAVPRLIASTESAPEEILKPEFWRETAIEAGTGTYQNIFSSERTYSTGSQKCGELFRHFPVAILERIGP